MKNKASSLGSEHCEDKLLGAHIIQLLFLEDYFLLSCTTSIWWNKGSGLRFFTVNIRVGFSFFVSDFYEKIHKTDLVL